MHNNQFRRQSSDICGFTAMTKLALTIVLTTAIFAFPSILSGQQGTGNIVGTVSDSTGAVVPDANVQIFNVATNTAQKLNTDAAGLFVSPPLLPGTYQLNVSKEGFGKTQVNGIVVSVGAHASTNITLTVGNAVDTVTVTAAPPDVNTSDSTLGSVISATPVHELPLNGREALALTALTPGVRNSTGPDAEGLGDRGDFLSAISVNGSPAGYNAFLIDGLNNSQTRTAEVGINPTADAIEEFRVQSGTMSAVYGFTAGGVVNLVTRSGTDNYHGALYEYLRNDAFDAKPYFTAAGKSKPEFRYNQFGGAMGGPIVHHRTFFFSNYEEYRYIKGVPTFTTVATPQERNGDFSDLFGTNGTLIQIYDPGTTQTNPGGSGYIRQPFPNNKIPSSRLDPAAVALQTAIYPNPNTTPTNAFTHANNYVSNVRTLNSMRQGLGRIDHQFSQSNTALLRYIYYHFITNNPDVLPSPADARHDAIEDQSVIASDTQVFSPTLINDLRFGFTRNYFTFTPTSYGQNWPQKLGLPSTVPGYTIPAISNGLPSYLVSFGFRAYTNPEVEDTVTKVMGLHTITFGTDLRMNIGSQYLNSNATGSYSFASGLTGNPQNQSGTGSSYATFLLGQVSSASATTLLGETDRQSTVSFFAQDDWKISRALTVNVGLRYDYQQQPFDQNNHYSNWNPDLTQPSTGLKGAFQFAGVNGVGRSFRSENYRDFSPRVGFAWAFTSDGKSVIRAGYGIYHPQTFTQSDTNDEAGFANTTSYVSGNTNLAAFQFSNGLPTPPIAPLGAGLGPAAFLGQSVYHENAHSPTPMSQQWNLSLQRELPWKIVAQATYAGNHGTHFGSAVYNSNQLDPKYLSLGLGLQAQVPNPYAGIVPGTLGGPTISLQQSLLPYPYYQSVNQWYPRDGSFIAHYFEAEVNRHSSKGLTIMAGYTSGKLISTPLGSGLSFVIAEPLTYQNVYDRNAERSIDPTDVSQRATITALYSLPFGKGQRFSTKNAVVNSAIGGWQINDITILQRGFPLAISGANNNLAIRPNFVAGTSVKLSNPSKSQWFNTAAFINPPSYTFGNVPRTLSNMRAPGTADFNVSLFKSTPIRENVVLQLRFEFFNIFNHPDLGTPNTTFSPGSNGMNASGSFGTITSTATDNRDIQIAARLTF